MYLLKQLGDPLLDDVHEMLNSGRTDEGMDKLMFGLLHLRQTFAGEWQAFVKDSCRQHPVKDLLHKSPFTHRAYHKPRGYAGDAVMMDYVYALDQELGINTEQYTDIYRYELATPGCISVRERRNIAARYIDETARANPQARMLSVACGHLREVRLCENLDEDFRGTLFALDQDEESLEVVRKYMMEPRVRAVNASVRSILTRKLEIDAFDFIYSLGLYDYLNESVAKRLTAEMFRLLRPGGKLLLVNFSPNLYNIGYMEAFMDWFLIYRDEFDMAALTEEIDNSAIADSRIFRDPLKNLIFLEVERRS